MNLVVCKFAFNFQILIKLQTNIIFWVKIVLEFPRDDLVLCFIES